MSGQPYTHEMHWQACIAAAEQNRILARKRVQVIKKTVVYCAEIVWAYTTPDGLDCWTVESDLPERARFTVACKNVRECPADVCACVAPALADTPIGGTRAVSARGGACEDGGGHGAGPTLAARVNPQFEGMSASNTSS